MDDRPIGVFDSGLGGLTVLREIRERLPHENIVYFGDCGRSPYGIKSPGTILRYTFQNIRFFLDVGVKLLVIACNTSSAYGYRQAAERLGFPVIEVIRPGSAAAARETRNKKVGVIGTPATVASRVYNEVFNEIDPTIEVFSKACPLFVPLVEEGPYWWEHEAARSIAGEYLNGFKDAGFDCLVLGCTHYPLLSGVIGGVVGSGVKLVSSARAVAAEVKNALDASCAPRLPDRGEGGVSFFTSDSPEKFKPLCDAIMGERAAANVSKLDIEKYESRLP